MKGRFLMLRVPYFAARLESQIVPGLRGRAFAVCSGENDRSQILGLSPEAGALGLRPGMLLSELRRRHPGLLCVHARPSRISEVSGRIEESLRERLPEVRPLGPGRFLAALGGCRRLYADEQDLGRSMIAALDSEEGLPAAAGIGSSPLAAEMIARRAGAGELNRLDPERENELILGFPVAWLPGVSATLRGTLAELGIHSIGDAKSLAPDCLVQVLGDRGRKLLGQLEQVRAGAAEDGRRNLRLLRRLDRDTVETESLWRELFRMCEEGEALLRREGRGARTLELRLLWGDGREGLRRRKLPRAPLSRRLSVLRGSARELLERLLESRRARVRRIELRFCAVEPESLQLDGFHASADERRIRLERSLDQLRARFGGEIVQVGLCTRA